MTFTTTCTVDTYAAPASFSSPLPHTARQSLRSTAAGSELRPTKHARTHSDNVIPLLTSNPHLREDKTMATKTEGEHEAEAEWTRTHCPPQPQSHWFKRLSAFSSRDSSRQPSPRLEPASMSRSASSMTFSDTCSVATPTAPMALPPNRLVKRSVSLPQQDSGHAVVLPNNRPASRLPKPVYRRPATSHQRSAMVHEQRRASVPNASSTFRLGDQPSPDAVQWTSYFVPKVEISPAPMTRRRSSTSIPNPIKRVSPDRRYHPTLLSANENIAAAQLEFDLDGAQSLHSTPLQTQEPYRPSSRLSSGRFSFSSPPMACTGLSSGKSVGLSRNVLSSNEERASHHPDYDRPSESLTKRSFSLSNLLPTDGNMWKRPRSARAPSLRYRRKGTRYVSTSSRPMSETQSISRPNSAPLVNQDRAIIGGATLTDNPHPSARSTQHQHHLSTQSGIPVIDSPPSHKSEDSPAKNDACHASVSVSKQGDVVASLSPSNGENGIFSTDSAMQYVSELHQIPTRHFGTLDNSYQNTFNGLGHALRQRHSTIQEEMGTSSPGHSVHQCPAKPLVHRVDESSSFINISSSPPEELAGMPSLLELRNKQRFDTFDDDQESSWSLEGDDDQPDHARTPLERFPNLTLPLELSASSGKLASSSSSTPSFRPSGRNTDKDTRSSIFDWSEQTPLDRSPGNRSPPRPKTVHGKKNTDNRGSRSVGRRAPSGLHGRSQSVPVVQEADSKRSQVVTNKFGTWGVGSKGVTEDWNEDFDFEEVLSPLPSATPGEEKRLDSGIGMFVPKAIREQQTIVLANIGLLRDWGLLIEELKELKMRAASLDTAGPGSDSSWREVDAMIELADQESDEHTLAPRQSSPSSPPFNCDEFDEPQLFGFSTQQSTHDAGMNLELEKSEPSPPVETRVQVTPATPRRPRKDSEAVAKTVIEALQQQQQQHTALDPSIAAQLRSDKVHFDTATLKRILPYVQELRDKVKKIIRDAEGLLSSPPRSFDSSGSDPSFSKIFQEPSNPPSAARRARRSTSSTANFSSEDGIQSPGDEIAARLRMMTVV